MAAALGEAQAGRDMEIPSTLLSTPLTTSGWGSLLPTRQLCGYLAFTHHPLPRPAPSASWWTQHRSTVSAPKNHGSNSSGASPADAFGEVGWGEFVATRLLISTAASWPGNMGPTALQLSRAQPLKGQGTPFPPVLSLLASLCQAAFQTKPCPCRAALFIPTVMSLVPTIVTWGPPNCCSLWHGHHGPSCWPSTATQGKKRCVLWDEHVACALAQGCPKPAVIAPWASVCFGMGAVVPWAFHCHSTEEALGQWGM